MNWIKRNPTEGHIIFARDISGRELISRIYKELKKNKNKKYHVTQFFKKISHESKEKCHRGFL